MKKCLLLLTVLIFALCPVANAYRDLENGTFLTRDPIGYADGPNVYCYVHCNPVTKFDALGLNEDALCATMRLAPMVAAVSGRPQFQTEAAETVKAQAIGCAIGGALYWIPTTAIEYMEDGFEQIPGGLDEGPGSVPNVDNPDGGGNQGQGEGAGNSQGSESTRQAEQLNGKGSEGNSFNGSATGAKDAAIETLKEAETQTMYGPESDPKVNPDGSTNGETWTTPDTFDNQGEAENKLDMFKPAEGKRTVVLPKGQEVQRGVTPGGESNGSGGANETRSFDLPPGSVQNDWTPLSETSKEG